MSIIEGTIRTVGRFAVGFGTGLALVCAFVIVETDPERGVPAPPEVVRLEPVVVTISADRYAELAAALRAPSAVVRTADHGAGEG